MDLQAFRNSNTGKLVKVGQGEMGFYAFVPEPLPPQYSPSIEVVYLLSQAGHAIGELAGLSRMLPNPQLLIRPFIRREAVLSSRIEGTESEIEDIYRYEIGQVPSPKAHTTPTYDDVSEVYNYVRALEYGIERLETLPLSLRFLRELHKILMEKVRGEHATPGEFRRSQNWIGKSGSTISSATFVPPPVEEMHTALNHLELYLHKEERVPALIRLAFVHYQFEAIHPFIDGNGRIGRLLITLLLVHWELLPVPLLYLSAYFEKHRQDYYDLLLKVSQQGAWEEWLQFFLQGVAEQAQDGVVRARALQTIQSEWQSLLTKERASALTMSVSNYLFEQPIVTANAIREHFGLQHTPALRILRRLVQFGILMPTEDQERNQQFTAVQILNVLGE